MERTEKPVKVGDVLELKCEGIGKKGDGIFRVSRFVVMTPKTEIGTVYRLKITFVMDKFAVAEVFN